MIKLSNEKGSNFLIKKVENEIHSSSFYCSNEEVNDFFYNLAKFNHDQLLSKVYIYYNPKNEEIIGFISLSAYRVNLPDTTKIPIQKVPSVLLGRLAIDNKYRGSNLGEDLIKYAIGICDEVKNLIGCRLLIVEVEKKDNKLLKYFLKKGFEKIHEGSQYHYIMIDLLESKES